FGVAVPEAACDLGPVSGVLGPAPAQLLGGLLGGVRGFFRRPGAAAKGAAPVRRAVPPPTAPFKMNALTVDAVSHHRSKGHAERQRTVYECHRDLRFGPKRGVLLPTG